MQLVVEFHPTATPNEYQIQLAKDPGLDWMTVHQTLVTLIHMIATNHLQGKPVPLIAVPAPELAALGVHQLNGWRPHG